MENSDGDRVGAKKKPSGKRTVLILLCISEGNLSQAGNIPDQNFTTIKIDQIRFSQLIQHKRNCLTGSAGDICNILVRQ